MKTIKILLSLTLISAFVGCAPRGETNTLQEILSANKAHFRSVSSNAGEQTVAKALEDVASSLAQLETPTSARQVSADSTKVVEQLSPLISKAGFTVRPALTELVNQYRMLGTGKVVEDHRAPGFPQVKLLVSRTYSLLASELETTRFML